VEYRIDAEHRLVLTRDDDGAWQASVHERQVFVRRRIASGVIHDSLFVAAQAAGLDDRTTMNLVDIFAWDIDFARDIQPGDRFRVLYEERFDAEGHELGSRILAAEFVNRGQRFRAVRFERADGAVGYYTPDGRSMRKNYLKAPLKFTRISSRFTAARKHPVLGYTRAHRGVDYAAPAGTAVHAVGEGRVIFAGWKGGYGRFVLIRHSNRIHSTAYAHLRAFARGIRRGAHVRQGQVIGYVGMSGLATGPHLHFEFRVRGRAVNPLAIRRQPASPVPKAEMARFRERTAPLIARLNEAEHEQDWG
ncbi:MAG: peptidoglycan DD-metalloendopeptidase family protein, partial [Mariprofundaceae bacterium]